MVNTYDKSLKIMNIPIKAIKPNPYQPRKFFDITSVSELARSIREYGILQPISVRQLGKNSYELVAGERRLRAAELADMSTVPAILVNVTDNDSAVLAIIENVQRKNLDFFEEAEAYYRLIKYHKMTQEQISQKTGKKQSTIANKLRIRNLSDTVKRLITENNLTERHARALLKVPDEKMKLDVLKAVIEKNFNVAETEHYIEEEIRKIITKHNAAPRKKIIRDTDYRIALNTIKKAVDMVKNAGLKTRTKQIEHEKYYEYVIKINKSA